MSEEETPLASAEALDLVRAELVAMDPRTFVAMNLDVTACALLVIAVAKDLQAYRAALVELCGEERTKCIDRLGVLARAALCAHGRYRAIDATVNIQPLLAELTKIRGALLADVRALIARDLVDPGTIGELAGVHGHANLAMDVVQLTTVLETHWAVVEGACGVTREELVRAQATADRLLYALAERDNPRKAPAADLRQRAFTLLSHTYAEARRLITYLRWHEGDYDLIAPSFFANRGQGRRRVKTAETPSTETSEVVREGMPGAPPFIAGPTGG